MIAFLGRMRRTHLLQDTTPHDRNQWLHESSDRTGKGMRQASRPDACTSTGAPGTFRRGVARHRSSLPDRTTVAGAAQVRRQDCLPRSPRLHARMHACRRRTPSCFPLNCKARKCPASTNQAILRGPEKIFRVAAAAVDRRLHAGVAGAGGAGRTHRPPVPGDRAEAGSPRAGGHAELSPCRTKANDSDA